MAEELSAESAEGAAAAAPKKSKKMLIIIIAVVLLLLIGGGGAAFMMMGHKKPDGEAAATAEGEGGEHADKAEGGEGKEDEKVDPKAIVYFPIPDMIVNLQGERNRPVFLKISLQLELAKATDQPQVEKFMPRIIDSFQIYLRELRVDELRGSAGIFRLREELLARVNQAVAPVKVRDVLFKDVLVQ